MSAKTADYENVYLRGNLESDVNLIKQILKKNDVLRVRTFQIGNSGRFAAVLYFDGMVNLEILNDSIIRPAITAASPQNIEVDTEYLAKNVLFAGEVSSATAVSDMLRAIFYGDTLLFVDNDSKALVINSKGWRTRGISEPVNERVLQGPREGFDEAAMLNLAMIRRRLLTPDLCIELQRIGRRTDTLVFICYLESLADEKVVKQLKKRISKINIDGVLDSNYITEHIRDHRNSIFKTVGATERPDVVAAALLEGRVALVVDGTPVVITLPYLFSENFQSDEDYYVNYAVSTAGRILRYICFFLSVSAPAVFVALTTFHLNLLPTVFTVTVARLRSGVPMSSFFECALLILFFEILKESGLRTASDLGSALGIVGGLVIGQAAVEARIVSAPMLIIVALSGISGLMVPRLKGAVLYLRYAFLIVSAFLGFYGYMALALVIALRILSLRSFGADYTGSLKNPDLQSLKDTFMRAPWPTMLKRPVFNKNKTRSEKEEYDE